MGVGHYENFPVASLLLPGDLRAPVRAIYRFARTADDLADEGDVPAAARLAALQDLRAQLDAIEQGRPGEWPDLADAVHRHALPIPLLRDLLSAFEQDVTTCRYADYEALLDYCRRSANPIGRLLLRLFRQESPAHLARADAICTGLQLVNFWQDVAFDWRKGRLYLPQSELQQAGLDEAEVAERITAQRADRRWAALLGAQVERARALLLSGAPLAPALGGRIGWELRLVVQGGLRVAERIDAVAGDVFRQRPVLGPADWVVMAARALRMQAGEFAAR
jgi:squalene synthase HpnC